ALCLSIQRPNPTTPQPRQLVHSVLRKWRNWQTHQLEGLALARAWGFESPLPPQTSLAFSGELRLGTPASAYNGEVCHAVARQREEGRRQSPLRCSLIAGHGCFLHPSLQ